MNRIIKKKKKTPKVELVVLNSMKKISFEFNIDSGKNKNIKFSKYFT